jgi:hypothetical protein
MTWPCLTIYNLYGALGYWVGLLMQKTAEFDVELPHNPAFGQRGLQCFHTSSGNLGLTELQGSQVPKSL